MEVIWSARAKITYFNVLDYLGKHWTRKEMIQFSQRTDIVFRAIRKNPGIFPYSVRHKNIQKAIVDKNNSFFHQVDLKKKRIYLLTFFDNRQNPARLKMG